MCEISLHHAVHKVVLIKTVMQLAQKKLRVLCGFVEQGPRRDYSIIVLRQLGGVQA